jgi:hypothetical protein
LNINILIKKEDALRERKKEGGPRKEIKEECRRIFWPPSTTYTHITLFYSYLCVLQYV